MEVYDVKCGWREQKTSHPIGTKMGFISVVDNKNRHLQFEAMDKIWWADTLPLRANIHFLVEQEDFILKQLNSVEHLEIKNKKYYTVQPLKPKFVFDFPQLDIGFEKDYIGLYVFHLDGDVQHFILPHTCDGYSHFENVSQLVLNQSKLPIQDFDSIPLCPRQYDTVVVHRKDSSLPVRMRGYFFVDRENLPLAPFLKSDGCVTILARQAKE